MPTDHRAELRSIRTFLSLVRYLRDEMDWPIGTDDFEELTFEYTPEELGIDAASAARIQEIKRLRPLSANQPWGIFFVKFEPKRLPVVALRRILSRVVLKKRASANSAERAAWKMDDLLFVSNYGQQDDRRISFAYFTQDEEMGDLPTLRVLGWDGDDTNLHLDYVAYELQSKLRWPDDDRDVDAWRSTWASAFTLRNREVITTSKRLAERLAEIARAIRRKANEALAIESSNGPLRRLMAGFQKALIHDLTEDDFADMYAQTIAYGLLSARVSRPAGLVADNMADLVPVTNPFLKELLETFLRLGGRRRTGSAETGIDFDELGINEVVHLLRDANMEAVLRDFGDRNPQEDPVIHFYELFLKEYDAKKRMQRGVFYTPRPVVSYIVRSVHELLQTEFGLADGLADTATWGEMASRHPGLILPEGVKSTDRFVTILDPATGTGTFLVEAIDVIHRTIADKWKREGHGEKKRNELWNEYVPEHLLPRLHGYELLMAPYAIAHLKIGLKLHETGYRFESPERARIYLTNALEPAAATSKQMSFADWLPALAHEAEAVNAVKRDRRFTVVIGNPPYSKMSANLSPAAIALVEPFRYVDGQRIVEKGALALELNLQDDYVKFWGLLCAKLTESGAGLGSYISNSRYLASVSLRGLRGYMSHHFSKGFFLNLGGQVSERKSIDGPDKNVFDIEQGVCIAALLSHPRKHGIDSVLYGRMTGEQADKYNQLGGSTVDNLSTSIPVVGPLYRFSYSTDDSEEEFSSWPALDALMPFNSGSIITSRDNLTIDFDRDVLLRKIERFARSPRGDHEVEREIGYSVKSKWDVERCKEQIRATKKREATVRTVLYRPFDRRYIYYLPSLLDTPSRPVCESIFDNENIVLLTPGVKTTSDFTHVLVSRDPSEKKACSHDRATQMFPLYSYDRLMKSRYPNFTGELALAASPQESLSYIYAILHSPAYRLKYGNALRDSYPRIPFPVSTTLFGHLAGLGAELIGLHLVEAPEQRLVSSRYDRRAGTWCHEVADDHHLPVVLSFTGPEMAVVDRVGWSDDTVWVDAVKPKNSASDATVTGTVGFHGVSEDVWNFHIGGYQACEKWLKDRKGRVLTAEDIAHYHRIVIALHETIRIMGEIDQVIEEHGGWPGAFADSSRS